MIKVLIVVVTRKTNKMGDDKDEFVHNWNTPKELCDSVARYIPLKGAGLLLVHGHSDIVEKNYKAIIAAAVRDILKQPKQLDSFHLVTLKDFESRITAKTKSRKRPVYLPVVLIHNPNVSDDIKSLNNIGCISAIYSLKDKGPAEFITILKVTLSEVTRNKRLTTQTANELAVLVRKELDPAALQVQYIHEIKELLLAIYLDAALMADSVAKPEQKRTSEKEILLAFKEIEERVWSTAFQYLKNAGDNGNPPPSAIYVIADSVKSDGTTCLHDFDKTWECPVFWKCLASQTYVKTTKIEAPDTKKLASDLQRISQSLQELLNLVGTKKGYEE
jgi:hypothetical protein